MIIKSLSRKTPSFRQLYNYINKQAEPNIFFTHNLLEKKDTVEQFRENIKDIPKRKNGVCLYHEILSFHTQDKNITPELVIDLGKDWLSLRAPNNLGYGAVHTHKDNIHIHLMISSNELMAKHNLRLTKKEFKQIQIELEKKQIEKYPHLKKSICQSPETKNLHKRKKNEIPQFKRTGELNQKDQLKIILNQATQEKDFAEYLKLHGIEIYKRGENNGIICQGKKYRFATLGFEPKLDEIINRDETINKPIQTEPPTQQEENLKRLQELEQEEQGRAEEIIEQATTEQQAQENLRRFQELHAQEQEMEKDKDIEEEREQGRNL